MWKADWKERLMNKTRSTIFLFKWGESKKLNKMKNENKSKQRKITEKKKTLGLLGLYTLTTICCNIYL